MHNYNSQVDQLFFHPGSMFLTGIHMCSSFEIENSMQKRNTSFMLCTLVENMVFCDNVQNDKKCPM